MWIKDIYSFAVKGSMVNSLCVDGCSNSQKRKDGKKTTRQKVSSFPTIQERGGNMNHKFRRSVLVSAAVTGIIIGVALCADKPNSKFPQPVAEPRQDISTPRAQGSDEIPAAALYIPPGSATENNPDEEKKQALLVAENDSWHLLDNFSTYKSKPYADEVLEVAARSAAENDPGNALFFISRYSSKKWAREILETIVEKHPAAAIRCFLLYDHIPYAKKILINAAKNDPGTALRGYNCYNHLPYAKKILINAAKRDTRAAVEHLVYGGMGAYGSGPLTKKILGMAAKREPGFVLEHFNDCASWPYADELMKIAARSAAERNPEAALEYFEVYQNEKYAKRVLKRAAKYIIAYSPHPKDTLWSYSHLLDSNSIRWREKIEEYDSNPLNEFSFHSYPYQVP